MLVTAAAVVLVVVAALVVAGGRDSGQRQRVATPPVANGLIAFDGAPPDDPSGSEIYVIAPDGTGLRALTSTLGLDEYLPAWSPDGSRLAFIRIPGSTDHRGGPGPCAGCQLVVVDPSTGVGTFSADLPSVSGPPGGVSTIDQFNEDWSPALSLEWSPDGELIMVTDARCGGGGCGGGVPDVVDLQSGAWSTTPFDSFGEWSPDGRWVLLGSNRFLNPLHIVPAEVVETAGVLDLDPDSLPGARRLALPSDDGDWHDLSGWMSDSSAVIDSVQQDEGHPWNPRIELISIADGERRTLIENGFAPVVSPDGRQIAFLRGGRPDGSRDVKEIWVAAADGSDPRRVTTSLMPPTWSPDSTLLLAMDDEGWFTVLADGTRKTVLPPNIRTDPLRVIDGWYAPSWQPLLSS